MGEQSPPASAMACPGCRQRVTDMAQVAGGSSFTLGEEADVLCFNCGETYVVTMTVFGWVPRLATAGERQSATRSDLFNFVRAHYADYRDQNPEIFGDRT